MSRPTGHAAPDPLRLVALMHGVRHLVARAGLAAKPHEQDKRDGLRLLPQIDEVLAEWPKPDYDRCVDDGGAVEHYFEVEPCPLHARAREAIDRLGLDGSRLETAVAVFGWGSDEANGSLLGLVRTAWGATLSACQAITVEGELRWFVDGLESDAPGPADLGTFATEPEALVAAMEARARP